MVQSFGCTAVQSRYQQWMSIPVGNVRYSKRYGGRLRVAMRKRVASFASLRCERSVALRVA
jgi:hypothetical protein